MAKGQYDEGTIWRWMILVVHHFLGIELSVGCLHVAISGNDYFVGRVVTLAHILYGLIVITGPHQTV